MLVESFSGIRGIADEDLTEVLITQYTLSYSSFLKKTNPNPLIVLGMDTRPSSMRIKETMKEIFLKNGVDVIDVELSPTPAIQHGVRSFKADGGVIITGSHNEPEHNGWKFLRASGSVLGVDESKIVIDLSKTVKEIASTKVGTTTNKRDELLESYIDFVFELVGADNISAIQKSGFTIVADPNGGTGATVIKQICEKLNVKLIAKNMELGVFNRLVEPNAKSLAYLDADIEQSGANLAVGWDCDADRVELMIPPNSDFVKERGQMVSGQYLLAMLVDLVLSKYEGQNKIVVVNDVTSDVVREIAEKHDSKIVEVEVGEVNVVDKMEELNAPIGGEGSSSGPIIPPSKCRDGIMSTVMLLGLMAKEGKGIAEILTDYPEYYTPRIAARCLPEKAISVRMKLMEYWKNSEDVDSIRTTGDETGGLKIIMKNSGWIWYRASKTEAGVFRIITDAKSENHADELLKIGKVAFDKC
jgi:phosphomannomutase / phosphoglucomutase